MLKNHKTESFPIKSHPICDNVILYYCVMFYLQKEKMSVLENLSSFLRDLKEHKMNVSKTHSCT